MFFKEKQTRLLLSWRALSPLQSATLTGSIIFLLLVIFFCPIIEIRQECINPSEHFWQNRRYRDYTLTVLEPIFFINNENRGVNLAVIILYCTIATALGTIQWTLRSHKK